MTSNNIKEPNKDTIDILIKLFNERNYLEALNKAKNLKLIFSESLLLNNILGAINYELKNYSESLEFFKIVIKKKPKYFEAYYNIGKVYKKLENIDSAILNIKKSIELNPSFYQAFNDLGNIYKDRGFKDKALENYCKSLDINSQYKEAYHNLGVLLQDYKFRNKNLSAENYLIKLLKNQTFVRPIAISNSVLSYLHLDENFSKIISKKSSKNSISFLINIIELSKNRLFINFLSVCPIPDLKIENKLQEIRKYLILNIESIKGDSRILKFIEALSIQCFINEYVYTVTKKETDKLNNLYLKIKSKKIIDKDNYNLLVLILSCYRPINSLHWENDITHSDVLSKIYKFQYLNTKRELEISKNIKSLKEIQDNVSLKVKDQYENNPYPRWINLGLSVNPKELFEVLIDINLNTNFDKIKHISKPKILIAGCGTGQHAITTASKYTNCDVTAIDLSLSSLSYAKRKAIELNFNNIEFLEGDILDLYDYNKKFDIIECAGVLHHMENPYKGWEVLKTCLNNKGFMFIGLYSQLARRNIKVIRRKIFDLKIKPTEENIIKFRNDIINTDDEIYRNIKFSSDFYALSTLRDLLFHVQEHHFTIPKIKSYIKKLDLKFIGFENPFILREFKKSYHNKLDLYNLNKWEKFEIQNPRIFASMYQFWCQNF